MTIRQIGVENHCFFCPKHNFCSICLSPAPLRALDLRAGAAMVVAALMADGTSEIEEIGHIERGYENIVEKLRGLGADIKKVERMPAALDQAL